MDEREATRLAEGWQGGHDLVARGPRWLLAYEPADPADVERHTGRRPGPREVWRIQVGGRFVRSGGLIYPGGVPFPDELRARTAVICSEVWLYVDEATGRLLGRHTWPEAVRKPIASVPLPDFPGDEVLDPRSLEERGFPLPAHDGWEAALALTPGGGEALVFLVKENVPEPLNEMVLLASGGLSLRMRAGVLDLDEVLRHRRPPFRPMRLGARAAAAREPGRTLGPQTWPWPAELIWSDGRRSYELKGAVPAAVLLEVAATMPEEPVTRREDPGRPP